MKANMDQRRSKDQKKRADFTRGLTAKAQEKRQREERRKLKKEVKGG